MDGPQENPFVPRETGRGPGGQVHFTRERAGGAVPPGGKGIPASFAPRGPHVVVVEMVYYQAPDDAPTSSESRFSYQTQTSEQPCVRRGKATTAWHPIDTGWLTECSQLVIKNREALPNHIQPTAAQREELAGKIIEVSCGLSGPEDPAKNRTMHSPPPAPPGRLAFTVIHPGTSVRLQPPLLGQLYIRCRAGVAAYETTALPR